MINSRTTKINQRINSDLEVCLDLRRPPWFEDDPVAHAVGWIWRPLVVTAKTAGTFSSGRRNLTCSEVREGF